MNQAKDKVLIIRFSSFGDIVQAMSCLRPLKESGQREIHWLTKSQFANVLDMSQDVDRVISFDKSLGMLGLIKLALDLRREGYTHIYDAHTNIRSRVVIFILSFFREIQFARRTKDRLKRIALFKFRKNLFPWPFLGAISFLSPIREWINFKGRRTNFQLNSQFKKEVIDKCEDLKTQLKLDKYVAIAPSAAWQMKRWPIEKWKRLVEICPDYKFAVLGGPQDDFCQEIAEIDNQRIINLAGKTNLLESCYIVEQSMATISGDTGILHVADLLGIKTLALIGPTAFGFPTSPTTKTISIELSCRPCTKDGRGKCVQDIYQKCMVEISPERVREELLAIL